MSHILLEYRFTYKLLVNICCFQIISCSNDRVPDELSTATWITDLDKFTSKISRSYVGWTDAEKEDFLKRSNQLKSELSDLSNTEVMVKMSALLAPLKDGHTEMSLLQDISGLNRIPLRFYFFEDELTIVSSSEEYSELLGKKVVSIEGTPIQKVYEKISSILAHDNEMEFLHEAPNCMNVPDILHTLGITKSNQSTTLLLANKLGESTQVTIPSISREEYRSIEWTTARIFAGVDSPLYQQHGDKYYWYKEFATDKMTYIKLNRIADQKKEISLRKFARQVKKSLHESSPEYIVVDIRNNRGGNYKKIRPLIKALQSIKDQGGVKQIIGITNRVTFSAAGVTSIFLKRNLGAQLYGEPSRSEPNGGDNAEYFYLPHSKLKVGYTNKLKDHYPELGDAPILPVDVEVTRSYDDFVNGIDPVMDKILSRIDQQQ